MKNDIRSYTTISAVKILSDGTEVPIGVVSDSRWKWYSPRKMLVALKIKCLNRSSRGN